jgi:hypothetical protein
VKKLISIAALLGSTATLVCCVIPALFVALGFGAVFAGILGVFPQLTWLSEHKGVVFSLAALLLAVAGFFQWKNQTTACPTDPSLGGACRTVRGWSFWAFAVSLALYAVAVLFVFVAPLFFAP